MAWCHGLSSGIIKWKVGLGRISCRYPARKSQIIRQGPDYPKKNQIRPTLFYKLFPLLLQFVLYVLTYSAVCGTYVECICVCTIYSMSFFVSLIMRSPSHRNFLKTICISFFYLPFARLYIRVYIYISVYKQWYEIKELHHTCLLHMLYRHLQYTNVTFDIIS